MSRCILVSGLPVLHRSVRGSLSREIDIFFRKAYINLFQEPPARPPKIDVSVNVHQRIDEPIRVIYGDKVDAETVSSLCQALQDSDSSNVISIASGSSKSAEAPYTTETKTFVPKFSLGAGTIRDHAFPSMPWEIRRQLRCDGVGVASLTHDRAATRMARLLRCFFADQDNIQKQDDNELVVDGMAGVGGNTMGFLKFWPSVVALELDPGRALMLEENIQLWRKWQDGIQPSSAPAKNITVKNSCLIDFLASYDYTVDSNAPEPALLFLDPPWVGKNQAQYKEKINEQFGDIIIDPVTNETHPDHHEHTSSHIVDCSSSWSLSDAVYKIVRLNVFQIVALKVPSIFSDTLVVDPLLHGEDVTSLERTHPFRFHFGTSTKLIVLVRNDNGKDPMFANGPVGLDRMIQNVMDWHDATDLQADDGCREHRPEFYDWEKKRWIMLKKWKGSTTTTAAQ